MHMHDDSSLDTIRTLPTHTLHSQSAVSFLTAGELLMIDRRIQEEKAMLEELNKSNDDSVGDVTKKTASEKKYYNSNSDSNHNSDIDENEVTIKRTKSFRKREQIQMAGNVTFLIFADVCYFFSLYPQHCMIRIDDISAMCPLSVFTLSPSPQILTLSSLHNLFFICRGRTVCQGRRRSGAHPSAIHRSCSTSFARKC